MWHDEAAEAKLDLLVTLDFRMNGSCLHSDVVLPAATWYEKHDISSTDLHPFVHAFSPADRPAVGDAHRLGHLRAHGRVVLAAGRAAPGRAHRPRGGARCCTTPRTSSPRSAAPVRDWKLGECEPMPGRDDAQAHPGRARLPGACTRR